MGLVAAASEIAARALPTIGAAVVAATAGSGLAGLPGLSGLPGLAGLHHTVGHSVQALIGSFTEAKEGKVFLGKDFVLKIYPTRKEAATNLLRQQTREHPRGYGPPMKSRDVGAMQVPEGERFFLIFKRLAPFKGEPTPEQRADLSAKITLMHKDTRTGICTQATS
jgi:hypothetical protein